LEHRPARTEPPADATPQQRADIDRQNSQALHEANDAAYQLGEQVAEGIYNHMVVTNDYVMQSLGSQADLYERNDMNLRHKDWDYSKSHLESGASRRSHMAYGANTKEHLNDFYVRFQALGRRNPGVVTNPYEPGQTRENLMHGRYVDASILGTLDEIAQARVAARQALDADDALRDANVAATAVPPGQEHDDGAGTVRDV
jgi:hypothetical protein